jgi:hypothetical protein
MTRIELPSDYAGWVEVEEYPGNDVEHVTIQARHFAKNAFFSDKKIYEHWFVPPKPKPTLALPDVGTGGVIRFHSRENGPDKEKITYPNRDMRAVKRYDAYGWDVHTSGGLIGGGGLSSSKLLDWVDDNGFTVELEGL